MRLSNSKAKTYRRCPNKYRYKYVEKLRPKRKAMQLERGSWIHDLLMHHYDGEDWCAHHTKLTKQFYNLFEEEREDLGDLPEECGRIMRAYAQHYKAEDKQFVVVDSEMDEEVDLPNGQQFNFIIDLVLDDGDGLWLVDHKTVKKFMEADFMLLDTQSARYFWAAEQMGYTPLKGFIFNEIRTKPPAVPQLLKDGSLSLRKNIDTDVRTYYEEIRRHALDPRDYADILTRLARRGHTFFRRTKLPKDPPLVRQTLRELVQSGEEMVAAERRGRFPRTPEKSCKWECEYLDLCQTELLTGRWPEQLVKLQFERRQRESDK